MAIDGCFVQRATATTVALLRFILSGCRLVFLLGASLVGCIDKKLELSLLASNEIQFNNAASFYPKHGGLIGYFDDSTGRTEHYYFLQNDALTLHHAVVSAQTADAKSHPKRVTAEPVNLSHLFRHTLHPLEAMGVIAADSLVFIDGDLHNICLTTAHGKVLRQWQPRAPIYGHTRYFIDTSFDPIYSRRNLLYLRCGPHIGTIISDSTLFNQFLSFKSGLTLSHRDTSFASNATGAFPDFLSAKNNYNITGSSACVSPDGHYIFSFGSFSELFDYDAAGHERTVQVPSRYHRPAKSLPFADLTNRLALVNYKLTEPEYGRILNDPYRRVYLRVYMHGLPDASRQAVRPAYADMPWSLLLINQNFERIGEITFSAAYDPRLILVTRRGILVGNHRPEHAGYDPRSLSFRLFTYQTVPRSAP